MDNLAKHQSKIKNLKFNLENSKKKNLGNKLKRGFIERTENNYEVSHVVGVIIEVGYIIDAQNIAA